MRALILFAKDARRGKVKTRLQPFLDEGTALRLYSCLLNDSLETLCRVEGVRRFVGVYPEPQSGCFDEAERSGKVEVFTQEGADLGERMRRAFQARFTEGCEQVVIVGADSPTLPVGVIESAFASDRDVILGPSTDGGYYLIGMNRGLSDIFSGVSWGTGRVLEQTLAAIRARAISLELLPVWYDVDRPEDLKFLKTHLDCMQCAGLPEGTHTREFLKQLNLEQMP